MANNSLAWLRAGGIVLAAAAAALLGGCAGGGGNRGPVVSVQNLSSTPVSATAVPIGSARVDGAVSEVVVPVGEERTAPFAQGSDGDGVRVEISPADSTAMAMPQVFLLRPPGPYLLTVTGNTTALSVARDDPATEETMSPPPDPQSRGFNNDLPPVNPR